MKKRVVLLDMLESLCWWKLGIENKSKIINKEEYLNIFSVNGKDWYQVIID